MAEALAGVVVSAPVVPVVANVCAEAVADPDLIRRLLVAQVTGSVRWRESVLWMAGQGVSEFCEVGAGKALSGMIKRIAKETTQKAVGTPEDVAALKGKTVAYEEGATSDLLLNYALQQNGMTLQDIQAAPMPAADAGSALIAKQVDAAVTYEPYISAAKGQDPSVQVIYTAAADPGLISDVLAARAGFAQENPETMKALLQVWDEAVQFLADNPDEGRAIIAKAVESDPAELVGAFDGVEFFTLAQNRTGMADGSTMNVLEDVLAVSHSIGLVKETPDLAGLLDASYLGE
jgi:ABC-type nitrate/sulfonate/bicarbonate transport system substrate-binding protein